MNRGYASALVGVLLLALGLRLAAANGEPWLDEIVSLQFAQSFAWGELVWGAGARHDNNHVLNTLYLRALSGAREPLVLRGLSIFAGVATVAAMTWIGSRRSRSAALVAGVLGAGTYVLVHYGSEARGYALAMALALVAWCLHERALLRPQARTAALFAGVVFLGTQAHASFGFVVAACLLWSAFAVRPASESSAFGVREALALWAAPIAIIAWVYFVQVRPMHWGGGAVFGTGWALWAALGECLGVAYHPAAAWPQRLAPPLVLGLLVLEIFLRLRERGSAGIFDAALFLGIPLGTLLVLRPEFVVPRYFAIAIPFALLLLASLFARALAAGWIARGAALCLLAFAVIGSGIRDAGLIRDGRGHDGAALARIVAEGEGGTIRIAANQPGWLRVLVHGYHAQSFPKARFEVSDFEAPPRSGGPAWYLHQSYVRGFTPAPSVENAAGLRYALVDHYPFSGLSGWHSTLYRREP